MSTPTKEQILRAFSLYIDQEVNCIEIGKPSAQIESLTISKLSHIESYFAWYRSGTGLPSLLLRDISSLTDEECKEIARLAMGYIEEEFNTVIRRQMIFVENDWLNVAIDVSGSVFVEKIVVGGKGALKHKVSSTQNQPFIQQKFLEWGINMPLGCLGGLTPVQAEIATIKKEAANGN